MEREYKTNAQIILNPINHVIQVKQKNNARFKGQLLPGQGSKKRSSVVAALPGRKLKCSNFPERKKGRKTKKRKEGENKGKKGMDEGGRRRER